jgi:hypothetical protein
VTTGISLGRNVKSDAELDDLLVLCESASRVAGRNRFSPARSQRITQIVADGLRGAGSRLRILPPLSVANRRCDQGPLGRARDKEANRCKR